MASKNQSSQNTELSFENSRATATHPIPFLIAVLEVLSRLSCNIVGAGFPRRNAPPRGDVPAVSEQHFFIIVLEILLLDAVPCESSSSATLHCTLDVTPTSSPCTLSRRRRLSSTSSTMFWIFLNLVTPAVRRFSDSTPEELRVQLPGVLQHLQRPVLQLLRPPHFLRRLKPFSVPINSSVPFALQPPALRLSRSMSSI